METELIEILTHRIRVLSIPQIARAFFCDAKDSANIVVEKLEGRGIVERKNVLARPILRLDAPIVAWRPGLDTPDFGKAAYKLKSRWCAPAEPVEIIQASFEASGRFGGYLGGRWPRTSEITHDLHLAEVFLRLRRDTPELATAWSPEARLYAEGFGQRGRLPDAVLRRGGASDRVVEFGGSYGKRKLQTFHAQMSALQYEIW